MKIAVVGGGPAGIFAALSAKIHNKDCEVILYERNNILGKKLLLTGKGRCNLSNFIEVKGFLDNVVRNSKFLYSSLASFTPFDTYNFYIDNGLELNIERGNRIFPKSNQSKDVVEFFKRLLNKYNVILQLNFMIHKITLVESENKFFLNEKSNLLFDKVILATGGASYPNTGSDGYGYTLASKFGHKIVDLVPGLVGLKASKGSGFPVGLSLKNIGFGLYNQGNLVYKDFGELLFTHNGISGPVVLSGSSHINRIKLKNCLCVIDLKPGLTKEMLDQRILKDFCKFNNKQLKNSLHLLLPNKIIPYIIDKTKIDGNKTVNFITREERAILVKTIKELEINILNLEDLEKAIVTSGGIDVKEINSNSMESKIMPNLFFAGEMIDVDSLTGGFNIQVAASTGFLSGKKAVERGI